MAKLKSRNKLQLDKTWEIFVARGPSSLALVRSLLCCQQQYPKLLRSHLTGLNHQMELHRVAAFCKTGDVKKYFCYILNQPF